MEGRAGEERMQEGKASQALQMWYTPKEMERVVVVVVVVVVLVVGAFKEQAHGWLAYCTSFQMSPHTELQLCPHECVSAYTQAWLFSCNFKRA